MKQELERAQECVAGLEGGGGREGRARRPADAAGTRVGPWRRRWRSAPGMVFADRPRHPSIRTEGPASSRGFSLAADSGLPTVIRRAVGGLDVSVRRCSARFRARPGSGAGRAVHLAGGGRRRVPTSRADRQQLHIAPSRLAVSWPPLGYKKRVRFSPRCVDRHRGFGRG